MRALDTQHGGSHYKDKAMQPVELWATLNLNAFQGAIVKYITRHKEKNGAEDIDKAEHFRELWFETCEAFHATPPTDTPFNDDWVADAVGQYVEANELSDAEEVVIFNVVYPIHFDDDEIYEALDDVRRENGYRLPVRA